MFVTKLLNRVCPPLAAATVLQRALIEQIRFPMYGIGTRFHSLRSAFLIWSAMSRPNFLIRFFK